MFSRCSTPQQTGILLPPNTDCFLQPTANAEGHFTDLWGSETIWKMYKVEIYSRVSRSWKGWKLISFLTCSIKQLIFSHWELFPDSFPWTQVVLIQSNSSSSGISHDISCGTNLKATLRFCAERMVLLQRHWRPTFDADCDRCDWFVRSLSFLLVHKYEPSCSSSSQRLPGGSNFTERNSRKY